MRARAGTPGRSSAPGAVPPSRRDAHPPPRGGLVRCDPIRPRCTGSSTPCPMAIGGTGGARSSSKPGSGRYESAERDERRRARAPGPEPERVGHHRALREAAEHRPRRRDARLLGDGVEPRAGAGERGGERLRIRVPDLAHRVPVGAARRKVERPARRDPEQASLGVEVVEQRMEVVLVRAPSVEEDEEALRLARGRPFEVGQLVRWHGRGRYLRYARRPSTAPKSACRHVACANARPFVSKGGTPGSPRAGW